jgi:hypothetical protein
VLSIDLNILKKILRSVPIEKNGKYFFILFIHLWINDRLLGFSLLGDNCEILHFLHHLNLIFHLFLFRGLDALQQFTSLQRFVCAVQAVYFHDYHKGCGLFVVKDLVENLLLLGKQGIIQIYQTLINEEVMRFYHLIQD